MKKRFTEERILGILREAQAGGKTVEQSCRDHGGLSAQRAKRTIEHHRFDNKTLIICTHRLRRKQDWRNVKILVYLKVTHAILLRGLCNSVLSDSVAVCLRWHYFKLWPKSWEFV